MVIEAWCLGYAWYYLTGHLNLGADQEAYGRFFDDFIGLSVNGVSFQPGHGQLLLFLVITFLANFAFFGPPATAHPALLKFQAGVPGMPLP